jgi:hypothetical protein
MPPPMFGIRASQRTFFHYNKMPLALMGCEAQVHEKTDKRSTWAYQLINGWYLFTLPEHYHTHNCHIKHTKSKRLSNTVQFQHKQITNPSITHTNKVMHALADCVKAIQGMMGKARTSQAAEDLQQTVYATQAHLQTHPPNLRNPQHRILPTTCNKLQGCRHHQVFPQPISMISEGSHVPCNHCHQFQGRPPMSLPASQPTRLPSIPQMSLPVSAPARQPSVGTLPGGYIHNAPLPRVPLLQSTSSETRDQVHMIPDYYEGSYLVSIYNSPCSIVERAAFAFSPAWHAIAINN